MSERLHYFNEAATPVAFDLEDSDIDSVEDALRRPTSEVERNKQHKTQFQLWSDEVRRRRTVMPPQRRPSSSSVHDVPMIATNNAFFPVALDDRTFRASMDRQPSNLSDRSRNPTSLRLSRSSSGKKLRIQLTPSSSTKSLTSDIDSDSMPISPFKEKLTFSTLAPVGRKLDDNPCPDGADHFRKCASAADLRTRPGSSSVSPRMSAAVCDSKRAYSAFQTRGHHRQSSTRTESDFKRLSSGMARAATVRTRSTHRSSRRTARPSLFRNSIIRIKRFLLNRDRDR